MASRRLRLQILGLLLVAAAALFAGGCSTDRPVSADTSAETAGETTESEPKLAPDFTLTDYAGETFRLSDSAGSVRLIDFWATWCPPCVEEIPMLKELHETYRDRGLQILAISDESAEVVQAFVEENEVPYPNLIDPGEVSTEYRVLGLPTAYLLDGDGRIVEFFAGPKPRKVLEGKIRELLQLDVSDAGAAKDGEPAAS
jgi:peroxiredoxin